MRFSQASGDVMEGKRPRLPMLVVGVVDEPIGYAAYLSRATANRLMGEGDVLLLCSDGLTTMIGDEDIARIIAEAPGDVARAATEWLRAAGYPVFWLTDPDECGDDGYLVQAPRRHEAVDRWLERSPCVVHEVGELPCECAAPVRLSG